MTLRRFSGLHLHLPADARRELLHDGAVARLDRPHDLRLVERAAVAERRVGERELQRRHEHVALADGHVAA